MRSFIAVDIPTTQALKEASAALKAATPPLKLVDLGILHLTLKFLGETPEERVLEISEVMKSVATGVMARPFVLRGMGAFPSARRVRVVWIGVESGGVLERIAKGLEEGLTRLGFPPEDRPFTPHVTLARAKVPGQSTVLERVIDAYREREFGNFRVEGMVLKKSILHPTGPEYHVVAQVPLAQPAG